MVHLADMSRLVQFHADAADEVELGLEEVDVVLLVLHQPFEQVARDVPLRDALDKGMPAK